MECIGAVVKLFEVAEKERNYHVMWVKHKSQLHASYAVMCPLFIYDLRGMVRADRFVVFTNLWRTLLIFFKFYFTLFFCQCAGSCCPCKGAWEADLLLFLGRRILPALTDHEMSVELLKFGNEHLRISAYQIINTPVPWPFIIHINISLFQWQYFHKEGL